MSEHTDPRWSVAKHPMQPVVDVDGVHRFKQNSLVRYLVDSHPDGLNALDLQHFSNEDWEQLAQLIGYSVSGFGGLSYASEDAVRDADLASERLRKVR